MGSRTARGRRAPRHDGARRVAFRLFSTASAPRTFNISRLNTQPAVSPVNASTPPSRATPHDSGPLWAATPSTYNFFIRIHPPASRRAERRLGSQIGLVSHISHGNHKEKIPDLRAGVCKMVQAFAVVFLARSDACKRNELGFAVASRALGTGRRLHYDRNAGQHLALAPVAAVPIPTEAVRRILFQFSRVRRDPFLTLRSK